MGFAKYSEDNRENWCERVDGYWGDIDYEKKYERITVYSSTIQKVKTPVSGCFTYGTNRKDYLVCKSPKF